MESKKGTDIEGRTEAQHPLALSVWQENDVAVFGVQHPRIYLRPRFGAAPYITNLQR